jgi:hypothetical protein
LKAEFSDAVLKQCRIRLHGGRDITMNFIINFMELSPSPEAANYAATQELRNPKVHYLVHITFHWFLS